MIVNEAPVIADSLWTATAPPPPPCPPLTGAAEAEVAIVGGGFTGLSAALHLAERGVPATVLEAESPGWGASGRNGGQVNPGLKEDPDAVEARFGREAGGRFARFSGEAGDRLFELIARHGIDCDARRAGWVQTALNETGLAQLRARVDQWTRRGAPMRMLSADEIGDLLGVEGYAGGLVDERGGTVQPLKLAQGLCRAAQAHGAQVHGGSRVVSIEERGDRVHLRTEAGEVVARRALICVNGYADAAAGKLARCIVPVRSVQVATEPLPEALRARLMPQGHHASDTQRMTTYFRMSPDGRFMIGGRGRFSDSGARADLETLRRAAARLRPELADVRWDCAWGGTVAVTAHHYPCLHETSPRILAAMGYNGRGVALATSMGRVLADWATGAPKSALDAPVTPLRTIPFHALRGVGVAAVVAKYKLLDALGV